MTEDEHVQMLVDLEFPSDEIADFIETQMEHLYKILEFQMLAKEIRRHRDYVNAEEIEVEANHPTLGKFTFTTKPMYYDRNNFRIE